MPIQSNCCDLSHIHVYSNFLLFGKMQQVKRHIIPAKCIGYPHYTSLQLRSEVIPSKLYCDLRGCSGVCTCSLKVNICVPVACSRGLLGLHYHLPFYDAVATLKYPQSRLITWKSADYIIMNIFPGVCFLEKCWDKMPFSVVILYKSELQFC